MFIGDGVRYLAIDRTLFILLRKEQSQPAATKRANVKLNTTMISLGVACGRAMRSYCTGISHRPVSAPIPNVV
ncbi:hypothetical protein ABID99_000001 [Mucilaginibacter sp. OAE612]|jgi:hypothetical protein